MEMKNGNGATQNGNSFRPMEPKRDPKVCASFCVLNLPVNLKLLQVKALTIAMWALGTPTWQAEIKCFLVMENTLGLLFILLQG